MDEDPELTSSPVIVIPESPERSENIDQPQNIQPIVNVDDNALFEDVLEIIQNNNQNYNSEAMLEHLNPDLPPSPILASTGVGLSRAASNPGEVELPRHSSQAHISNEDSNLIIANEESNSLASCPENRDGDDVDVEEPPAKVRKISSPKQEEGDGETCPICLDTWGNSGEHRLVALKCGHLFGWQCVERWLKAQATKDRTCPTCKSKANLKDMRFIYARRLVAADTSQIAALQKQIDVLKSENSRAELELLKSRIAHRACVLQLEVLRSTLMKSQTAKDQPPRRSWRFALEKNQEVSKDGGCRVLTYNCRTYELYVSQKSTNNLFPGYGIRKVSCIDYKLGQFIHLHPKPIRDITYSQPRDLLLSVGLDSSVRIIERGIPSASIQCGMPLWSCSWDYLRSNEFCVGGVGGVIHQYDVRNTNTSIQTLNTNDLSPVVSLCSTEHGLLSCQLNSCWLWESNMRQWIPKAIPIDGPFVSLCYDNDSHRALITSRASGNSRSKLTLFKLKANNSGEIMFDLEQTFVGSARSTLMSRGTFVRTPGAIWAAAHSESESALNLHGLDGARTMTLPAVEPALDICTAQVNGDTIVAALSESRLRLYKAVATSS
ncbi:E3 ubiquitin-protein ligase RFWD3-like [Danaus plexippus]|uniref:E3 ubiquitin-protein ligase RFWD3-like n=1 Tax=Danaus plexippus TaxID=13037 RepID=UPI002AB18C6E|nr:E3 ubiquitin-protein ligase RFWD3-like [Danaus plexippus]